MDGVIIVTGASAGIGAAAALELTRLGRFVLATGRSPMKLAAVHERMRAVAPEGTQVPEPIAADFSSLASVRQLARTILDRHERLDCLVNNAGVQPARRQLSHDGFELAFAVNHLAPFLLTNLLAERLRRSAGRVVTTSSSNHAGCRVSDLSDLQMDSHWRSGAAYDRSKAANVLFTMELPRRTGLPASCFHPGSITTDLNRESRLFKLEKLVERFVYGPPEQGADTLVWLATSPEGAASRAVYYVNRAPAPIAGHIDDPELAARLWDRSCELVGLVPTPSDRLKWPA